METSERIAPGLNELYAPPTAEGELAPASPLARERMLLIILAAVQLANVMDFMIVMPLGPELMDSLKISAGQFGLIVASYTFSASAAGFLAALVFDRFDRRKLLLLLIAGFTLGTFSCGWAPSFRMLVMARIVTGAFGGVLGAMIFAIIGDEFPDSRRGAATGTVMSAFAVASVIGVPLGLVMGHRFGWASPFLLLGLMGVIVWLLAAFTMPRLVGHLSRPRTVSAGRELAGLIFHPNHLRAFMLMSIIMIGSFAVVPYIASSMVANSGVTKGQLPLLYVLGGVCVFFSSPWVGRISDRFGKLSVYKIMAVLSIFPTLLVTNLGHVPLIVAMLAVAGVMVCNSGRMVPAVAMITASVEPSRRGGFMSVNAAIQHLSIALGTEATALILGESASVSLDRYRIIGLISIVTILISLPLAARLRAADPSAIVHEAETSLLGEMV